MWDDFGGFKIIAHFHCLGAKGLNMYPLSQVELSAAGPRTISGVDHKKRRIRMELAARNMEVSDEAELRYYMARLRESGIGPAAIALPDAVEWTFV